jgi:hypothetical protein
MKTFVSNYSRGPRSLRYLAIVAALMMVFSPGSLLAQGTGGRATISGTVTDSTGAVIPDATVTALNTGTGITTPTKTTSVGTYVLPLLQVGNYTFTVQKEGFKTETRAGIILTADQAASVDFTLTVGAVTQQVEVTANAQLVEANTAALGQVVGERSIVELPINGRNPASLVLLTPGTVDILQTAGGQNQAYTTHPAETGASSNGGRQGSTYYLLDGGNNIDPYLLLAAPFPNPDATEEFRVIGNNFGAQYGFSPGAVVSIVTKSGTNAWHGDAFEFVRNSAFNAADFFSHQVDGLKRNQYGGSIGGPILKNRLFIFGNYQETDAITVPNSTAGYSPTAAERGGDFSALLTGSSPIQITNPSGVPYTNNYIDPTTFSPGAVALLNLTPAGAAPYGLIYLAGQKHSTDDHQFTIRADYSPSEKHRITGRAFFDESDTPTTIDEADPLYLSDRSWNTRYQNYGGNYVWTIRPNIINNLVASYGRQFSTSLSGMIGQGGKPVCFSEFINVADPATACAIEDLSAGIPVNGQTPSWYHRYLVNVTDSVTISKGKHLIVAGVDVQRMAMADPSGWLSEPLIGFSGSVTGYVFSDYMLGQVYSFEQGEGSNSTVSGTQLGFYAQDDIKLKPHFTLNVGLRWEPFLPPTPLLGRFIEWRPGEQSHRYPNSPLGLVYPGDPGVPAGGFNARWTYFNPRIGFAWQPEFLKNTSIRGAFGIFMAPLDYSNYTHGSDETPFSETYSFNRPLVGPISFDNPWASFAGTGGKSPFPPFLVNGAAPPTIVPPTNVPFVLPDYIGFSFDPNFNLARDQTWNFSIERQFKENWLLRAAYVGSETYHLATVMEHDPGIFANGGARINPLFTSITQNDSIGTASYNSLQVTLEKRFSRNLQFVSNYTYSKALDTSPEGSIAFTGALGDPFDTKWARGISSFNYPNVFVNNWVYQTPALAGSNSALKYALGSWQLSGIWRFQSGTPFDIQGGNGDNNSESQVGGDRADFTGQPFDVRQGSKNNWLMQYFNPKAFQQNAPGTFGNTPRNLFAGPGTNLADIGIFKNFSFKERYRVQFRWELFNAFNHPHFGNPDNSPTDPTFGQIVSTSGNIPAGGTIYNTNGTAPARVMQLALKLYW